MLLPSSLIALALAPSLVFAAIFPKSSMVKMLNAKEFKEVMKENQTSLVAFVAPWCGHCQRMVPEYSKAALGLYPLIPCYAVDCDAEKNKRLCTEQGVKGFPTVKLYPRGNSLPPMLYELPERTASGFWYFATRRIAHPPHKLYRVDQIKPWVEQTTDQHRALLLTKDKKVPLLWKVLSNKYHGQLGFGTHRDRKGKSSVEMGMDAGGPKDSKVLIYPAGSTIPVRYEGINKFDSLSKFFDSVLDGTADLTAAVEEAKKEEFVLSPEELEIEQKQEAQRIALLHGGFTDLIDFEKALKEGGSNFHDSQGYGGMMGAVPEHLKKKKGGKTEEADKKAPETPKSSWTASMTEGKPTHDATATPEPALSATPARKGDTVPTPDTVQSSETEQVMTSTGAPTSRRPVSTESPASEETEQDNDEEEFILNAADQVVLQAAQESAAPCASCQCSKGKPDAGGKAGSCASQPAAEHPKDEL